MAKAAAAKIAQVGDLQAAGRRPVQGRAGRQVGVAAVARHRATQGTALEVQPEGQLQRRGGAMRGRAAAATPGVGQGVGQGDGAAVEHDQLGEAVQQRRGRGLGADDVGGGLGQQQAEELGGLGGEPLDQGLGGEVGAGDRRGVGQAGLGGVRVLQPGEDQRLGEPRAGQQPSASDKAAPLGDLVGDGRQEGLHGAGQLR